MMRETRNVPCPVPATLVRGLLALMLGVGLLFAHVAPAIAGTATGSESSSTSAKAENKSDKGGVKKGKDNKTNKTSKKDTSTSKKYVARFNVGDSFSSKDYDVPRTLKDCIATYGKDAITADGYTRRFKLPKTSITLVYNGTDEDMGPISVEGQLNKLVSGIKAKDSVSFADFAKGFQSASGAFDLASYDKDGWYVHCGKNLIIGARGCKSLKDYATFSGEDGILFAEDAHAYNLKQESPRVLWVDVKDGKVTGKSNATLMVGMQ